MNIGFDCEVVRRTAKIKTLPFVSKSLAYILGVVLLIPLQPILQAPALQPAFDCVVPALFGAMAYKYYRGNLKIALPTLLVMGTLFILVPSLTGSTSFMILENMGSLKCL